MDFAISAELYAWLASIELFKLNSNFIINTDGNVVLEEGVSKVIKNGYFFLKLFEKMNEMMNGIYGNIYKTDERLFQVANDDDNHVKMKNWGIILEVVKNYYGIIVDNDFRTMLVASDQESFNDFFQKIYKIYLELEEKIKEIKKVKTPLTPLIKDDKIKTSTSNFDNSLLIPPMVNLPKIRTTEDVVDLADLNPRKEISHTRSVLEFIIITLCKALSMAPKQVAALLADGKKYLNHISLKEFEGIFAKLKHGIKTFLRI